MAARCQICFKNAAVWNSALRRYTCNRCAIGAANAAKPATARAQSIPCFLCTYASMMGIRSPHPPRSHPMATFKDWAMVYTAVQKRMANMSHKPPMTGSFMHQRLHQHYLQNGAEAIFDPSSLFAGIDFSLASTLDVSTLNTSNFEGGDASNFASNFGGGDASNFASNFGGGDASNFASNFGGGDASTWGSGNALNFGGGDASMWGGGNASNFGNASMWGGGGFGTDSSFGGFGFY